MERRLDRTVRAIVVAGVSVFGPSLGANWHPAVQPAEAFKRLTPLPLRQSRIRRGLAVSQTNGMDSSQPPQEGPCAHTLGSR